MMSGKVHEGDDLTNADRGSKERMAQLFVCAGANRIPRRGKLRKVTGNRKQVLIRERLNGETRRVNSPSLLTESIG